MNIVGNHKNFSHIINNLIQMCQSCVAVSKRSFLSASQFLNLRHKLVFHDLSKVAQIAIQSDLMQNLSDSIIHFSILALIHLIQHFLITSLGGVIFKKIFNDHTLIFSSIVEISLVRLLFLGLLGERLSEVESESLFFLCFELFFFV